MNVEIYIVIYEGVEVIVDKSISHAIFSSSLCLRGQIRSEIPYCDELRWDEGESRQG